MNHSRYFLTWFACVFLLIATHAALADFGAGVKAYLQNDFATAIKEFTAEARKGNADAQFLLGNMYRKGQGVPQDYAEAAKWYRKSAEQGDIKAQHNLGVLYENGQGLPRDYVEAVKWYHRSADQGHVSAQLNLGVMYAKGHGVPRDYVKAYMWFHMASSVMNQEVRATAVRNRDIVSSSMTPHQIAEAQRLAREWRPKKSTR